jgi:integrase/recombinase XerD
MDHKTASKALGRRTLSNSCTRRNHLELDELAGAWRKKRLGPIRDRAMLHLGFAAGLRVSELSGLLLTGVTLQPTPTVCVMGKGRKQRSLPLWKQTAADIRAWLAVRDQSSAPELFLP